MISFPAESESKEADHETRAFSDGCEPGHVLPLHKMDFAYYADFLASLKP
jgi:hypothetical protein